MTICIDIFNLAAPDIVKTSLIQQARERLPYLDWDSMIKHGDKALLAYDQRGRVMGGIEFSDNPKRILFDSTLWINRIETADDCSRQGVSKTLLRHIFALVKTQNIKKLTVCYFSGDGAHYLQKNMMALADHYKADFDTEFNAGPL